MEVDLNALAGRSADPAAGSAVAVTAAQGAALLTMSLRHAGSSPTAIDVLGVVEPEIDRFARMPARDAACFEPVARALGMGRDTAAAEEARAEAIERALPGASVVLAELACCDVRVLASAGPAVPRVPTAVAGDCAVAVELLRVAAHSAALLARSNAALFRDEAAARDLVGRFEAAVAEADRHAHALRSALDPRLTR